MSPTVLGQVVAQAVLFVLVGHAVADPWLRRLLSDRAGSALGLPERALVAFVGAVGFSIVAMVAHIVTGGAVFGTPWVVPAAAIASVAWGMRGSSWPRSIPWARIAAAAVVLGALYFLPVLQGGIAVRTGDPALHMGWTQELLHGEPIPSGPAPAFGRNGYPWGFHAVLATMVRLAPTTDPLIAQEAMHLLLIAALPLAAAGLGRRLLAPAGWGAAAAGGLIGGFGWVIARGPEFITIPRRARFGADLVTASPNSVYELFPPALPREVGLVLLAAGGILACIAVGSADRRWAVAAGGSVGLTGLVNVPLFATGLLWLVATIAVAGPGRRRRLVLPLVAPAVGLFALWAGPVVSAYLRYEGFVDITPRLGKQWPLVTAFASWGLLLLLAVGGIALVLRTLNYARRTMLAFVAVAIVMLALSLARSAFDWDLAGNETVLHQGRIWPVAHLLAAAFAGVALYRGHRWMAARSQRVAAGAIAAVLVVGAASPALASRALTRYLVADVRSSGYIYDLPDLRQGSFVRRAASHLGPDDIVRVEGSDRLAHLLFQFSGVRLADFDDPRLAGNDLRIRYRNLAQRWDARIAAGGFEADYLVRPAGMSPLDDAEPVEVGDFDGKTWTLTRVD